MLFSLSRAFFLRSKGQLAFFLKEKKIGRPNSPELKQIMGSILLDFAGELAFKKTKQKRSFSATLTAQCSYIVLS